MRQLAERMALAGHDITVATSYVPDRNFTSHNGVKIRDFKVVGNATRGMVGEVDRYRNFVSDFDADAILTKAAQQWTFDALWPVPIRSRHARYLSPVDFRAFTRRRTRSILSSCQMYSESSTILFFMQRNIAMSISLGLMALRIIRSCQMARASWSSRPRCSTHSADQRPGIPLDGYFTTRSAAGTGCSRAAGLPVGAAAGAGPGRLRPVGAVCARARPADERADRRHDHPWRVSDLARTSAGCSKWPT